MTSADFWHTASDGKKIFVRAWLPEGKVSALLLLAHGMAEHGERYARLAKRLCASGWAVYAPDHRGHGKTAEPGELGWFAEKNGFTRVLDDLHEISQRIKLERPGLPLFLFGHSMGSVLAEAYSCLHGAELGGCALSGVVEPPKPALFAAARGIAASGCLFKGQRAKAMLLTSMSFGANNKVFAPTRSTCDWLSRDAAEVDKYLADPLCGFPCSNGFFRDFFAGIAMLYQGGLLERMPKTLPLLIMAGGADPVGGARGFHTKLAAKLRKQGLVDVELREYPGARHEILNDINRDQVSADLAAWLDKHRAG